MNDSGGSDARRVLSAACEDLRAQLRALTKKTSGNSPNHLVLRVTLEASCVELQEFVLRCPLYPQARFSHLERSQTVVALGERYSMKTDADGDPAARLQHGQRARSQYGGRLWFALRFAAPLKDPNQRGPWDAFGSGLIFLPRIEFEQKDDRTELLLHLSDTMLDEIKAAHDTLDVLSTTLQTTFDDGKVAAQTKRGCPDAQTAASAGSRAQVEQERFFQSVHNALTRLSTTGDENLQKVVLARRAWLPFSGKSHQLLQQLRRLETPKAKGASYFFAPAPQQCFLGCSPELLFSYQENKLRTEAVAGTRPRGRTPAEDEALEKELRQSSKEVHEHELVATHIREALQALGFSHTPKSEREVRRLSRVMHLVSPIEATWHAAPNQSEPAPACSTHGDEHGPSTEADLDLQAAALLARLHPTPALAGSPQNRALDFLHANEGFDRGLYAGPFGFLEGGHAQVWIALRGGHWDGKEITLYAGAGIVPGSTAADEWQETEAKLSALREVLQEPK